MKPPFLKIASFFLLACAGLVAQTLPPGTGACQSCLVDTSWVITHNDTGVGSTSGPSIIVSSPSSGWASPLAGTHWIGPAADQTNPTRDGTCCMGSTTYQVTFNVTDPASYGGFAISLYADNFATIELNGAAIDYKLEQEWSVLAAAFPLSVKTGFLKGSNMLTIDVFNQGGPGGLDVSFAPLGNSGSSNPQTTIALKTNSHPELYSVLAAHDPVDSGSGQFYDTVSDIELGGPMNLGFRRYYSSQLANGGVTASLGTNWMNNLDPVLILTGSTAKVLTFNGTVVTFTNSGSGWQLIAPKEVPYQFIQNIQKFQFMDPETNWVYTFSTPGVLSASIVGSLTSIADRNGNTVTITQGANGPTQVSDGLGRTLTFTYANGQLAQVTDQAGRTVSFSYAGGLLTSTTDIYKQTTTYSYTTVGSATALMTTKQLPLGNNPTHQTYDAQGRTLTQRIVADSDGSVYTSKFAYDGNGGTTVTDGLGNVSKDLNDGTGNILQATNPNGATAIVTYDGSNRRTSITDKLGNKTSYTYDAQSGLLSSTTDALGNTTSVTYASQAQGGFTYYYLASVSYPDGTSIGATYDPKGNLLIQTGQKGTTTKYTYDSTGRMISITAPNQQTTTLTWNVDSTAASTTDALGNKRTYTYDNTKRMASAVDPNGGTTGYVRDKSTTGPMLAIVSPVKGESTTLYDDPNREIQDVAISTGGVYHSDYTATGQIQDFIDPLKNKTSYVYDGGDRMSTITSPAGEVVKYTWDASNRVTAISDLIGLRSSYTYTAENKIATATDGSGKKASYSYDAIGRLQAITTPGGNTYKAGYDKLGNVASLTNPLGEAETLTRDAAGAVISATMPGATTTSFVRDTAGQVTSMTTPSGNTWTIGYDALERPVKSTDPLGNSITFNFTGAYLTGATMPLGTVAVTNDADGRVTQRKFSDGTTITAGYDTNGMLISSDGLAITRDAATRLTNINGIGITLDADSRPATLTYAAGKAVTYTYDKSGRVSTVSDWVGGKTTLAYDGAGRLTSLTYPNGIATTYTYDADGRMLTTAAGSLSSIALTRDAAGKITSANRNVPISPGLQAANQQFSYDAAAQLTSATSDAMGRVTAQNGRKYTWNLASQLTAFADGANSATFTYDGLGEMSSSTASGSAQSFVFNYLLHFPALSIVRQGGSDLRYYVYFPSGTLLYSIEAADNSRHFYHFDEMGNTIMLTGDSGAMTDSYAITPYGENADHVGTTSNPFTWQGRFGVMQEGQGLYYLRSRHYDASAARFVSRDAKMTGDPRSSEPYTYARGNPLKYIDPLGNLSLDDLHDAAPLIQFVTFVAALNGADTFRIDVDAVQKLLLTAIEQKSCVGKCAFEGWELVDFIGNHNDLTINALGKLLTPPIPPPAPDPPGPVFIIGSSPMPPQLGPPVAAKPTLPCLTPGGGLLAGGNGLIGQDGSGLIGQDGSGLIGQDGSGLIGQDGSGLIGQDGSGIVASGAGNLLSTSSGNIVASGAGNIVASGAGNIVASGAGNIVNTNGSNFHN